MTLSAIVTVPAGLAPADFTAPIAGEPALVRAVRAVRDVAPVSVVAAEELSDAAAECLAAHDLSDVPVRTAPAPLGAGDQVLMHDVRYPLAPAELAARVAAGLADHDVVLPVLPMTDSVKAVATNDIVLGNVDRSELVTAQYPRAFSAAALARCAHPDDLAALTSAGLKVGIVDGDPNAVAVDLAQDRALLEAIVAAG
ncbi:2-C-methyl-D-erythritol 4-phosphate cytidylyltransferase [Mycobacterium sp. 360MFTsu5.1]|uniref:IspD/TarI family cytidylyltransferase n=1 Tax=Mycobacterium sp. 360MFTsu5.1 TaxID=1172186 RepID=UPI00039B8E44|nr:2-C-methyl-D-erythritol 4-phosphate cytidylyltransferase [Mycobacterium sp. 360MFTsu5.1]